ncbi:putative MFS-type transporter [Temnothorax longispinosus]|uniref:Putative MFS-type transporter n=1 Tax=Temnothorax longispinosus TaxID=300112 RepID=A0A4S2KK39_9HYME|nr:putative MFS-type transporter [Temnothorax longispinosus]
MDNEQRPLVDVGRIATSTKFAYALGHIFNDLAAAMWFSYTLIYLQRVALLKPIVAGALLLLGQIVDAVMTPVFGFLVDRYCKKKIWHVVGSVMVTLSFPVIFGGFVNSSTTIAMLLYVTSITIFQTGWAAVQISHLSMIPSLTNSVLARADLTAIRYSAQVGAAVIAFVVTWIILPTDGESMVQLDQQDDYKFRPAKLSDVSLNRRISWAGITILLRVAMLYVASRLFITLATVYLPLYIEETKVDAAAAVTEFVGSNTTIVYVIAVLIGAGSSITMVTALSVTAELIGSRTERSAFVYSIVTFLDKIITGLVVIFIEKWRCNDKELCPTYNRDTLSIVCASSMILGLVTLLSVSRCLT